MMTAMHGHSQISGGELNNEDRLKLSLAIDLMDQIALHLLSHTHYPHLLGHSLEDGYWGRYQNLDAFFRFLGPVCTGEFLHTIQGPSAGDREVVVRIVDGRAICFGRDLVEDAGCETFEVVGNKLTGGIDVGEAKDAVHTAWLGREFPLPDLLHDVLPEKCSVEVQLLPLNPTPVAGEDSASGLQKDRDEVKEGQGGSHE